MDWWVILLIVIAVVITICIIGLIMSGIIYRATAKMAPPARLDGKTVIVTGSSAGIGKRAAMSLAQMGARVIMACRNLKKTQPIADDIIKQTGNNNVVVKQLDVSDFDSVRKFAAEINEEEPHIHVLLNNAGILMEGEKRTSPQGFELIMATNHYGCFLLTNLLIGKLKASGPSRVVTVSSTMYKLNELNLSDLNYQRRAFSTAKAYSQSKLCNILFAKELSRRLEGTGVTSNVLHPGLVATNIFRNPGKGFVYYLRKFVNIIARTEEQGAQTSIYLCSAPEVEGKTGEFYVNCSVQTVRRKAADMNLAKQLWETSAEDVKLSPGEAAAL